MRVTRGGTTILDGVSWRVERGEHWVILGANGSGKTSLLSALTAYLTPSSRVGRSARVGLRAHGLARIAETRRAGQLFDPANDR